MDCNFFFDVLLFSRPIFGREHKKSVMYNLCAPVPISDVASLRYADPSENLIFHQEYQMSNNAQRPSFTWGLRLLLIILDEKRQKSLEKRMFEV